MEEGFTRGLIRILINLLKKFSLKSDTEFTFYSYTFLQMQLIMAIPLYITP